ncbi:Jag N-terminal domain-containing protein [Campylobacter gastrosuis]|uniref:Jag N-terminal domain-containing protein n=1 Tax=Campylobacter gastrosuis TaxID=2974576 RepID=A0ABT7HQD6_9BACT|nr:Jag N-terminal domain-containing protein [Campylobacter gastrosuis]MDL0089142.1 Jag N-terminal domain-containing protein [Campylobacter gastrosuis]
MRVEASNLQEAFSKAAEQLGCSVTELDVKEIIQHPSSGFLGFFKKNAIIEVEREQKAQNQQKFHEKDENRAEQRQNSQKQEPKKKQKNKKPNQPKQQAEKKPTQINDPFVESVEQKPDYVIKRIDETPKKHESKNILDTSIIDNFHQNFDDEKPSVESEKTQKEPIDFDKILPEIKRGLETLFGASCFEISKIEVSKYSDDCVLIELDGADAALLIGKEGYRYKAISYLLHNWLGGKFNLSIRLEIAEFLKNQEAMMDQYLLSVVERVEQHGKAQTKPLDGVLVKIALAKLREKFPQKYVGIKSNGNEKFVVVNEFFKK